MMRISWDFKDKVEPIDGLVRWKLELKRLTINRLDIEVP